MSGFNEQHALLWIRSAHEAIEATTELLTEIAPHWEVVMKTSYCVDLLYNDPGYKQAEIAAKAAWLQPCSGQLARDLDEQADWLAESLTATEEAERNDLPLPLHDYQALHDAHQAACSASAHARRTNMQLSGEYLLLDDGSGPDLLIRNQNQATLQAILRTYWQPLTRGEASEYAMAPANRGLAQWLNQYRQLTDQPNLLRQYLKDRNTSTALGLDIFCVDDLPDWDCPMGVLMLFATPSLAQMHMQRLQHDARVHWWPNLAAAESQWNQPSWPPDQRVQLCPFDLRRDKIWEGNQQVCLLP